ncbi:MAG: patatin-like phospholipase family protein [Bacteroidia bacterium]|nr:patatin-like phospholipase family protein [Bacteroidia bacterium]
MKALVISGGGSKGAFGGGIAEYLIKEQKKHYDLFIGSSAGSLIIPLASIGETERLKNIFTGITQRKIFNVNPFLISNINGVHKISINHAGTMRMFIGGKKTFGESHSLRKLIRKTVTESDFEKILSAKTKVMVCVSNISRNTVEYFSAHDCSYNDFCDWMWASSNMVPFMSVLTKNGCEYADGGLGNRVPIREAIQQGATEVDAIILSPKDSVTKPVLSSNAFDLTFKVFNFMLGQISKGDILIGRHEGTVRNVKINFYFTPRVLTEHSLVFNKVEMTKWWQEGLEYARNNNPEIHNISA